jgi:hypothetical protein
MVRKMGSWWFYGLQEDVSEFLCAVGVLWGTSNSGSLEGNAHHRAVRGCNVIVLVMS